MSRDEMKKLLNKFVDDLADCERCCKPEVHEEEVKQKKLYNPCDILYGEETALFDYWAEKLEMFSEYIDEQYLATLIILLRFEDFDIEDALKDRITESILNEYCEDNCDEI